VRIRLQTGPANFDLGPMRFSGITSGSNVTGRSNPAAIPGGVQVSKQFNPHLLFGGMSSSIEVTATNAGRNPLYNASVTTTLESFATLVGTPALTRSASTVLPGGNLTLSYGVTANQVAGNLTGTVPVVTFYFGGTSFTIQGRAPSVEVYQPLQVSISTSPGSPIEGKNFTVTVQITNPSGVSVSNVLFTIPVPSGLGLSNFQNAAISGGVLSVSVATLAGHSSATGSARAVASSGITIPFDKAKLTFQYLGATVSGTLLSKNGIAIGEDVTTRYILPTAFILLAVLAVAFYVRRKAAPSAPASPK
jgi:hypothetical protein